MLRKGITLTALKPVEQNKDQDISKKQLTLKNLNEILSGNADIVIKDIDINSNTSIKATLFYVDGMVDSKTLDANILRPLLQEHAIGETEQPDEIIQKILRGSVYHTKTTESNSLVDCLTQIMSGSAVLVFDEVKKAVVFEVKGFEKRAIVEPSSENVIKGSKEGFIEALRTNTTLVRRKLKTHNLKVEQVIIGKQSLTSVAILYIDGLTNMNIVNDLRNRLQSINIDGVITAGNVEDFIVDNKFTFLPQTSYTERVDTFCFNLLEGRVGLLIDGLPVAYSVPVTMDVFYRAPEDYAQNYVISTGIKFIRYFAALITTMLPAFYIAVTTFHQEMIPSTLAISIINSKEGVPFPTFMEILLMLLAFEILLEAGLQLPKAIGQALSIVGALIVGDAAVNANVVSPVVVIVVAFSAICGFVIPNQDMANALRLIRVFLVFISALFGLIGMTFGITLVIIHESKLVSFGTPYMAPFISNEGKDLTKYTLIRLPFFILKTRPENLKTTNQTRQQ